jgi:hypothetical protein
MMKQRLLLAALLGSAGLFVSGSSLAAELVFTGSATATARPAMAAACAPLFRGQASGPGTSTLGSFTYSHDVCTPGTSGPLSGTFILDFGGSLIEGGLTGSSLAREGVMGLFDQQFTYTVLSGTGLFSGATGSFMNIGTVDVRNAPPSVLTLNFNGLINAPMVPEPSTWAMMLVGFGVIGGAMRSAKRRQKVTVSYA